ncbi:MAG: DUF1553 domain-containing protein [Planctomycetota bacterium]|jgi:hypothetical protein
MKQARFFIWFGCCCCLWWWGATPAEAQKLSYNRDVRPILTDNCFACHGPDSAARQADLRLDKREAAVDSGAIEPGEPDSSQVVERIYSTDPDLVMPPPSSHKQLTEEQKQTLRTWIAEGANYEAHWSLIPPQKPILPAVKNNAWVRNPIDVFVLAKLESLGLQPATEADLPTLVRRAALDLTGLPPTPAELAEVLQDPAPDRYERYLDRLLAKPQWGEHRGRYWLDYARYADTHGIHFDNYREVWAYRDWVINAFNANQPFDQFTVEQLAGDLLPSPSLEQQVATGFNRCNITTNEGGVIGEEYLVLYARDRVETTSLVWLGLTAGCAVCHDHKYDPITQKEFYELAAFFNNTVQDAMDGNIKDTPPNIFVPLKADRDRWQALKTELAALDQQHAGLRESAKPEFDAWLANQSGQKVGLAAPAPTAEGLDFHALLADGGTSALTALNRGQLQRYSTRGNAVWQPGAISEQAWQVTRDAQPEFADVGDYDLAQPFTAAAWVKLPHENLVGAIAARMDEAAQFRGWDFWLQNGRVGTHLIHQWPQNALKVVSRQRLTPGRWHHVAFSHDGSGKPAGIQIWIDGESVPFDVEQNSLSETTRTATPFRIGNRSGNALSENLLVQGLRLYQRVLPTEELAGIQQWERNRYLFGRQAPLSDEERAELLDWYLRTQHAGYRELTATIAARRQEYQQIERRGTRAHVMAERGNQQPHAYVLFRGDYDKRRDQVFPDTPDVLPPLPSDLPRNRLGLAQWLVRPENPLTSRVTVNRFWQEVFGQGLVSTSGDFGVTGQLPSHPELLDYLAVSFREEGWDVKRFFKQLLTSATYRQSAVASAEKLAADPGNVWLSRGPRFRMDAEMIRDYALAASGLLYPEIGGPSVRPYQPPGVWEAVAMPESNTKSYREDDGANLYRRSMYTFWKRAAPPASMDILNAPNRETCTVRRDRTNTPLQALVTLNDPQFVEAARSLAQRLLAAEKGVSAERQNELLQDAGRTLLARTFTAEELAIVNDSLTAIRKQYEADPAAADQLLRIGRTPVAAELPPTELASWTMLLNQLMNLDELLNK